MTRRVGIAIVAGAAGAIVLGPLTSEAQVRDAGAPITGTGAIYGRVTTGDGSNQPVRRAAIQITGGRVGRAGITDDNGRYVVDGLPDGHYAVVADRPPYVRTWAGAKSGDLLPQATIDLLNGQRVEANISMARGAVLSGLVLDPSGHPRSGQLVNALRLRTFNGKRSAARGVGSGSGITDDRGVFRIFGLAAGDYVLSVGSQFGGSGVAPIVTDDEVRWARQQLAASTGTAASTPPLPARAVGFSPVYYPGTADLASATPIALAAAEERDGLDIALVAVPVASVDGTVTNPDGSVPASSVQVMVNGMANGNSSTLSRPAQAGYFSFPNLPPGSYTILARLTPPGAGGRAAGPGAVAPGGAPASRGPAMFASAEVDVNGQDVKGLSLVLQPAMTVSGRVTVDPAAAGTLNVTQMRLTLSPVTFNGFGSPQPLSPAADGSFTFTDVMPGPVPARNGQLDQRLDDEVGDRRRPRDSRRTTRDRRGRQCVERLGRGVKSHGVADRLAARRRGQRRALLPGALLSGPHDVDCQRTTDETDAGRLEGRVLVRRAARRRLRARRPARRADRRPH